MTTFGRASPMVLAAGLALAGCEPKSPSVPLIPLSYVEGEHSCFPGSQHLYERGGVFFCAAADAPTRWPKRVTYAVLGADVARFEPEIAAVIAEAHTITGAEMVRGGRPDLIVVLDTEPLDADQVRALAARAGVTLSDADVQDIVFQASLHVTKKPSRSRSGGGASNGDAMIASFDARRSPDEGEADHAGFVRSYLQQYVLGYFAVEAPLQGFICEHANEPDPKHDPVYLAELQGIGCPQNHILMRGGGENFCAGPIAFWPRAITYAAIGPAASAHADDVAVAAAHLARLTGRSVTAGAKPSVIIALVDRPFDESSLRGALTDAHVTEPPNDTAYLMTVLSMALYAPSSARATSGATSGSSKLGVRTQFCDIELEEAIRADGRQPDAIRKDIEDAFLRILEITPQTGPTPEAQRP